MSNFTEISLLPYGDRVFFKDEFNNLWRNEELTVPTGIKISMVPFNNFSPTEKARLIQALNGEIDL